MSGCFPNTAPLPPTNRIHTVTLTVLCCAIAVVVLGQGDGGGPGLANDKPSRPVRPKGYQAKVTLRVVDEEGRGVTNVLVDCEFPSWSIWKGSTDTNGIFVIEGDSGVFETFWRVRQPGYYVGHGKYKFTNAVNRTWHPWNPVVTQVMRRIEKPIAMYAKKVELKLPLKRTDLGFDLWKGDWVSPYGKGDRADFVFAFSNSASSFGEYEGQIRLTFTAPLDGLAENKELFPGSDLRLPRYAPQSGYQTNWFATYGWNQKRGGYGERDICGGISPKNRSYFVRVRSIQDENGRLKEAYYAKIAGQFQIIGAGGMGSDGQAGGWLKFCYYLNPTANDRNMEFDPEHNLFQDLTGLEEVWEP